jgi:hypothetical protein
LFQQGSGKAKHNLVFLSIFFGVLPLKPLFTKMGYLPRQIAIKGNGENDSG